MKTSTIRTHPFRSTIGTVAIVLASLIGVMTAGPAFADRGHGDHGDHGDNGHHGHHDRGRHEGWRNDNYRDNYYDNRDWRYERPYTVYAPPPVYYNPRPSVGVHLFFPVEIH